MKKLLIILSLFLTAFSTLSVMPPGWYQQTLPVNDFVNDIYFVDTLNGWIVTQGHTNNNDTAYIMKTTNGGDNWNIQYARNVNLTNIRFANSQTGYAGGGSGTGTIYIFKTTNGGGNWIQILGTTSGTEVEDMHFINADTGWFSDDNSADGGVYKTTNGGGSWTQQINQTFNILRLHFINADTGWASSNDKKLYRTTNGGTNWNLQHTFAGNIADIYFFDGLKGINSSGFFRTTDGGFTWTQSASNLSGFKLTFADDMIGWAGGNFSSIRKTTDGGITWGTQSSPIFNNSSVFAIDSTHSWAAGSGLVKSSDGGGPIMDVELISSEMPDGFRLYQNFPNPFNPLTRIDYELLITNYVTLTIYDINGKVIKEAINEKQNAGRYQYTFDGSNLTSGVYFYRLQTENFIETKKMLLIK